MKVFIYLIPICLSLGCATVAPKDKFKFSDVRSYQLKVLTQSDFIKKLGQPDKKEHLPEGIDSFKKPIDYWEYESKGALRLHLTFFEEKLISVAYDIYEKDPEYNLAILLKKLDGNFKVIKEPARNPHAMPSMCYLVDEKKGVSVLVSAVKRAPEVVSFWLPELVKNPKWFDDSTPEFCIAGHCSRVTDPDAWKYNHCEWLEKLIVK